MAKSNIILTLNHVIFFTHREQLGTDLNSLQANIESIQSLLSGNTLSVDPDVLLGVSTKTHGIERGNHVSFSQLCNAVAVTVILTDTHGGRIIVPMDCFGANHSNKYRCFVFSEQ